MHRRRDPTRDDCRTFGSLESAKVGDVDLAVLLAPGEIYRARRGHPLLMCSRPNQRQISQIVNIDDQKPLAQSLSRLGPAARCKHEPRLSHKTRGDAMPCVASSRPPGRTSARGRLAELGKTFMRPGVVGAGQLTIGPIAKIAHEPLLLLAASVGQRGP